MARIATLAPDLFFASKIGETLSAAGHEVIQAGKGGVPGDVDLVIVDLDQVSPDDAPEVAPRLGFYSHVDVDKRRAAEAAGFDLVVPRSRMAREMPELVASLLPPERTM